ncbi:MAG: clan AA aspartic protease [Phycisphaerae bacterium]|nr:clan AA aspartic protease [Phycisphaerae bacterium]
MCRRGYLEEEKIRRIKVNALVDRGAYMLVVPEHVRLQLGLEDVTEREALIADGTLHKVPVVGPVNVRFENRLATCNAMVLGTDTVLLGALPLEELDVVIEPRSQTLIVNPENPTMPKMIVM